MQLPPTRKDFGNGLHGYLQRRELQEWEPNAEELNTKSAVGRVSGAQRTTQAHGVDGALLCWNADDFSFGLGNDESEFALEFGD